MTQLMVYPLLERDPHERARAPVIASPLVTPTLTILYPPRRNRPGVVAHVALTGSATIGREGDIMIDDGFLNPRHAELVFAPDGLRIRDLDTTNGTFVNGHRVRDEVLRVGDVVMVGQERLWFRHTLAGTAWPARAAPLLAAIRDDPADDATRLVLADLLTELGDPRGEFIARQLSKVAAEPVGPQPLASAGRFIVPVHHWTVHRGLVDAIYVDDLSEAEPLRDDHPLAELRLARPLAEQ